MEIKTGDISTFPPEVQKEIRTQILAQAMDSYGMEIREAITTTGEKTNFEDSKFQGYGNLKMVIGFRPLEKGCETLIANEKYPMRGCFNEKRIKTLTQFKKLIPVMVKTLRGNVFYKLVAFLYLRKNWEQYLDFAHSGMRDLPMKRDRYCQPVREMHRILSDRGIDKIRDILCVILEWDTAYRYRFQDVIAELDKVAFNKNPIKELKRLAEIMFKREIVLMTSASRQFKNFMPLVYIYLFLNRKLLNTIKEIVNEANIDELKMSVEDIYWTNQAYQEYEFRGIPYKQRMLEYEAVKNT
jgi:hypothetical protein